MTISIVVPVFNARDYLEECIKTVLEQTSDNWELILVDDGSTDSSADICDEYAGKYPLKIKAYHKANEGQCLTRLYGINMSTGDYIAFLDADDLLDKDFLSEIKTAVIKGNYPDVICFGFCRFSDNNIKQYPLNISEDFRVFNSLTECRFVYGQIIDGVLSGSMCSKVFKAELLKNADFDNGIVAAKRFGEDAFQSYEALFRAKSIAYLNKSLYHYRMNMSGTSEGYDKREADYFNTKYVFELIASKMPLVGMDTHDYEDRLFARNFNETVYYMLKYFRAADSLKRKKYVVTYDWSGYLLHSPDNDFAINKNIRQSYIGVWKAFKNNQLYKIWFKDKFRRW